MFLILVRGCICGTSNCTCATDELALTTAHISGAELAAGCLAQTLTPRLMGKMGHLLAALAKGPDAALFMLSHRSYR